VRGELTWCFLWMDVVVLILADPNMDQAYRTFLDFLQALDELVWWQPIP